MTKARILELLEIVAPILPAPIYWEDVDSVLLGGNNAVFQATGAGLSSAYVGKTLFELYPENMAAYIKKHNEEVMRTGKVLSQEEEIKDITTGETKYFTAIKAPLHDDDGNVIGIVGTSIDITEEKKLMAALHTAKEKAEAANTAKSAFIANMSHDIRTPLTGVIGLSGILEQALENPEQKEEAHLLHDSGEELLSMLNDILDDVRSDDVHENEVHERLFNLHNCIEDLIKLERPTTKLKQLDLFVTIATSVPQMIISDKKKIHRILLNLLGNAIKFTPKGHISIDVKCLEETTEQIHLKFTVSDTGIGISEDIQEQVFERFFRATPSYQGLYKGHGLGLHIAQTYVALLGGHITLMSKLDEGTSFSFDIWCRKNPDNKLEQLSKELLETTNIPSLSKNQATSSNMITSADNLFSLSFLLVEDSPTVLKVLQTLISKKGHRYLSALDGETGLQLIKDNHFDLIITDIGLPGISGIELTSKIRAWEKKYNKKQTIIVGLTGHAQETARAECLHSGMNEVFTKPATLTLIDRIVEYYTKNNSIHAHANQNNSDVKNIAELQIKDLFNLEAQPLFDAQHALAQLNDLKLLFNLANSFLSDEIQSDIKRMIRAHDENNWQHISDIAHKLKGGAIYIGTLKFYYACQYLEQYYKSGQTTLLEQLYSQVMNVNKQSVEVVSSWLKKYNADNTF